MNTYKADLHIHTVLSPCGDLDMSPSNIIRKAQEEGLAVIGITDHNSTRQCAVIQELGQSQGIEVLAGAEVTTSEEVHCLAFFEHPTALAAFQQFLDERLPTVKNKPETFGYQVVVDANDLILHEEEHLLISAIDAGINEIADQVHALQGIFIPAHIDKMQNSLYSQLGFFPADLQVEGMEISRHTGHTETLKAHPELQDFAFIQSSDAHYLHEIGSVYTNMQMDAPDFANIRQALANKQTATAK